MVFVAGHFGEWIQGRLGPDGEVVLVTLCCPTIGVRAARTKAGAPNDVPAATLLGEARLAALLSHLGLGSAPPGGCTLAPTLPPGLGTGVSTAALVSVARLLGAREDALADACLHVEGASDPLMLETPDAVLWAPRRAEMLKAAPPPPKADVVGGIFGPPEWTDPADTRFPDVSDLVARWQAGGDLADRAEITSLSAARTTALRGPSDDPTPALARQLGALGYARAHTGPARALIFAPGAAPPEARGVLAQAGFTHVLQFETGH